MDRKKLEVFIADNFLDIVIDEIKYFQNTFNDFSIKINVPILANLDKYELDEVMQLPLKNRIDAIHSEVGFIYFYYDLHKVRCKSLFKMQNKTLDRHKISSFLMLAVMDYMPIRAKGKILEKEIVNELIYLNYRIAFRFAMSFAAKSLFHSFADKVKEYQELLDKDKDNKKEYYQQMKKEYEIAIEKMKKYNCLLLPKTREELESYVFTYIKSIYIQMKLLDKKELLPYMLISDTFYWIDIYTKMQLGITVEPEHNGDMYGLRRYPKAKKTN